MKQNRSVVEITIYSISCVKTKKHKRKCGSLIVIMKKRARGTAAMTTNCDSVTTDEAFRR